MAKNEIIGKLPPQNIEAEQAVIGAVLVNKDAIDKIADVLIAEDFYRQDHQKIFRAIFRLFEKRAPIDLVTLTNELEAFKELDAVGGAAYLAQLVNTVPTALHVLHYAEIVRHKATLRRILEAGQKIAELGYEEEKEVAEILDQAESALFGVSRNILKDNFQVISDILAESFDRIDRLHREKGLLRGVPTGFKDLDNKLSGLQPSDLVILAARPSMGKCVAGQTEILNPATGELVTAKEVVEQKQAQVVTLDEDWQLRVTRPSHYLSDGVKPTFRIKTALGREIEATLPHPFLTITGWKRLVELKVGDRIATAKELPFFGQTDRPDYQVKLLAYMLADGSMTSSSPRFTNVNPKIIKDFVSSAKQFGNTKVRQVDSNGTRASSWEVTVDRAIFQESRRQWSQALNQTMQKQAVSGVALASAAKVNTSSVSQWRSGSVLPNPAHASLVASYLPEIMPPKLYGGQNPLIDLLKDYGVWGQTATTKALPSLVFTFKKEKLALFLNRLFSCDGTAYVAKCGGRPFPVIGYSSSSKRLIGQLQHLLTRFGIVSKVRPKSLGLNGRRFKSYELEIHGREDLLRFIDQIGIYGKEDAVEAVRQQTLKHKPAWTKDSLPIEIWQKIDHLRQGRSWSELALMIGKTASHSFHPYRRSPRRETVRALAVALGSTELEAVANSQIYWDRIVSIEPVGCQPVYDLTVDATHNFVANDFIAHNTTFALNIALQAAVKGKVPVGFFSLEQSKEQIVDRLICSQAMVDGWKLRTGNLSEDDFPAIGMAMGTLAEAPLYIDDSPNLTSIEIRTKARRLRAEQQLGLIIIDYLQLLESSRRSGGGDPNRVQEVSEISRSLKALARELNVPVIALSQLSRAVESRENKMPQLSDLRESGSIEQDADVVMFLYREDYYNRDTERKGITDLLIRKHRNGPIGEVELHFKAEHSRFYDLERKIKTPPRGD